MRRARYWLSWAPVMAVAGVIVTADRLLSRKHPVPGEAPEARTTRPSSSPPAPGPGKCLTTVNFMEGGVTEVLDHTRRRRIIIDPATQDEADAAFLARIEAELERP
jgi:hypothetical protein